MAKAKTSSESKILSKVYGTLALVGAVVLVALSVAAFWAHSFTADMVTKELSAQKIYFPEKGSAGLDTATFPDLQQYAGQLVDTPEKAQAYANGFIGRHLDKIGNGKTYAEVSTLAQKDPTNAALQAQKQTLFQGQTLRGMLLGDGYGFGTIGEIAGVVAYGAGAGSIVLLVAAVWFLRRR